MREMKRVTSMLHPAHRKLQKRARVEKREKIHPAHKRCQKGIRVGERRREQMGAGFQYTGLAATRNHKRAIFTKRVRYCCFTKNVSCKVKKKRGEREKR
jgi:hypothetical protein